MMNHRAPQSTRVPQFPTPDHSRAAEAIVDFSTNMPVEAVLLVNSCARGTATPESDLDVALLIDPELPHREKQLLDHAWHQQYEKDAIFRELEKRSRFARVHLDIFDGRWKPELWDDGGGPDAFEIEIGNRVAYSAPLWERSSAFTALRARYLPYYDESLQNERLRMVSDACHLDIERIHFAVSRGLDFYGFDRLYHAFQEFLQALFIARRIYPIAYNKWIREQIEALLGLVELYPELPPVLAIGQLNGIELVARAERLRHLLLLWTSSAGNSRTSQQPR